MQTIMNLTLGVNDATPHQDVPEDMPKDKQAIQEVQREVKKTKRATCSTHQARHRQIGHGQNEINQSSRDQVVDETTAQHLSKDVEREKLHLKFQFDDGHAV